MGFSVYGRIGSSREDNYKTDVRYPKINVGRNYLTNFNSSNYSNQRVAYNPKSGTNQKKENKALKTFLILAGSATAAYLLRRPIESGLKALRAGVSRVVGPTVQRVSNVTIGDACRNIASPFKKLASLFNKKTPPVS